MKHVGAVLFGFVLLPLHGFAAEKFCGGDKPHVIDAWLDQELDKTKGVTVDIRNAQTEAYNRWDSELNRVYKELIGQLSQADRKYLQESQQAWLKYRDLDAKFFWTDSMYGSQGTAGPVMASDSGRQLVKDRVCQLKTYLDYRLAWGPAAR